MSDDIIMHQGSSIIMTSADIDEGVKLTLRIAHALRDKLGRRPRACEIRWRVATEFQRRWTTMDRRDAVKYADTMMEVVATAAQSTT